MKLDLGESLLDSSQVTHATDGLTEALSGTALALGDGFKAESFRAVEIGRTMDPLVMVDHYVMTEPTFGAHPHAGMSAVSLLFEDSEGLLHNRDSLGNDFDLRPGDLYWLSAGSGAVHDESPRAGSRTHGLQVFINVPHSERFANPSSRLVRSEEMPIIEGIGYRVKVAMGESGTVRGAVSPSTPMTVLDGSIEPNGQFYHRTGPDRGIWVHAIRGGLEVTVGKTTRHLSHRQAIAIDSVESAEITISNPGNEASHFALFDGAQIDETYVQEGPFVMTSQQQIVDIKKAYAAGELGTLAV